MIKQCLCQKVLNPELKSKPIEYQDVTQNPICFASKGRTGYPAPI
jgi:hypothetical protein